MADSSGARSKFFPAIEKKHGEKIDYWIKQLRQLGDAKYPDQIMFLRHNFGFSQSHANALVMYVRGSTSSKRFSNPDEYFASIDPTARKTAKAIMDTIMKAYPQLKLVVAWNQPILRSESGYVFGLSVAKNHVTLNPFSEDALNSESKKLAAYGVNKKTFIVPLDWNIDAALLKSLVKFRLAEMS